MLFTCHRINTISELKNINNSYGIEIDLRDDKYGNIILSHDPFSNGQDLNEFLKYYNHSFIILNIKSEGIEFKVLDILNKYNIIDYFFLDCSIPMIYKLSNNNINNIAIRFSEFESFETVLNFKNRVKWVWIDCFTYNPLNKINYDILKSNGFKLCFVSPELQNQQDRIEEYKEYFDNHQIELDMICTKSYNIYKWRKPLQVIIPMSGIGKRFIDAGYTEPKPLIIVDNKPIIEHVINLFPDQKNINFICNDLHLNTTNMYNVLNKLNGKIFEVSVNDRQGPVHAISQIFNYIDDNLEIIVSYCDYGTYWNYDKFLNYVRHNNLDGCVLCYKGFHPHMLGNDNYAFVKSTSINDCIILQEIQEKKPFTNNKMNEYASNGTYYFKNGYLLKKYFDELIKYDCRVNNEFYVSMVYNLFVADGLKVGIYEIDNMLQWGTPSDLEIYKDWSLYFDKISYPNKLFYKDKLNTTLILPMAGNGSRFSKKNYKQPKPLINVDDVPMVIKAVDCLPNTTNKVFIILKEHIDRYNIDTIIQSYYPESVIINIENVTQGQACTCEIGINNSNINLEYPILISACDNGVLYDKQIYQNLLDDTNVDIIVWTFCNKATSKYNPNMYAWIDIDENNYVKSVSCKKFDANIHDINNSHVIIGTMFYRKAKYFIDGLNENYKNNITTNNEFYVDDVINQNINCGLKVKVFEVEHYICWGTPDDYETYLYWKNYFHKCNYHNYNIYK